MAQKQVSHMDRIELINELRRYAHPEHYHAIIRWETNHLRGILAYYREMSKHKVECKTVSITIQLVPVI